MNKRFFSLLISAVSVFSATVLPCTTAFAEETPSVTLRVCNWEEYIDLGGWDEDETIELESGDITSENSMIKDFENWYKRGSV